MSQVHPGCRGPARRGRSRRSGGRSSASEGGAGRPRRARRSGDVYVLAADHAVDADRAEQLGERGEHAPPGSPSWCSQNEADRLGEQRRRPPGSPRSRRRRRARSGARGEARRRPSRAGRRGSASRCG